MRLTTRAGTTVRKLAGLGIHLFTRRLGERQEVHHEHRGRVPHVREVGVRSADEVGRQVDLELPWWLVGHVRVLLDRPASLRGVVAAADRVAPGPEPVLSAPDEPREAAQPRNTFGCAWQVVEQAGRIDEIGRVHSPRDRDIQTVAQQQELEPARSVATR